MVWRWFKKNGFFTHAMHKPMAAPQWCDTFVPADQSWIPFFFEDEPADAGADVDAPFVPMTAETLGALVPFMNVWRAT